MPNNQDEDLWELLARMEHAMPEDEPEKKAPAQEPPEDEDFSLPDEKEDDSMLYRNYSNGYGREVRNYSNNYGRGADGYGRGAAAPGATAGDETRRFDASELPQNPAPQPKRPARPTQAQRAAGAAGPIHAYNADFHHETERAPEPPEPEEKPVRRKDPPPAVSQPRRKHRGRGCLVALLIPVLLIALVFGGLKLFIRPIHTDQPIGQRKAGTCAVLLCGADLGGIRTDTMMLLYIDSANRQAGLLTLPRDTYTRTSYGDDAKLNSAYGRNGCGEEGMEVLLDYVKDILGYRPDGYVLLELPAMEELVDLMGGVDFDVPTTISFEQSYQHDEIYLEPGMQHLDGAAAMAVLRFRYGYYNQDIGRQDTQKAFLKAAMKQWFTLGNVGKLSQALKLFRTETLSNLSTGNYLWLAWQALRCGTSDFRTDTLPGYADYIGDQSFYILYPGDTVELVNEAYNPYRQTITRDDVHIVGQD